MLEELLEQVLLIKRQIKARLKEDISDQERVELEQALKMTRQQEKDIRANL